MPPTLRRPARAWSILVLSLLLVVMSLPAVPNHFLNLILPSAYAATIFTVNSTGDGADNNLADGICNDGTGACTLRAAIQQANPAGGDSIDFSLPSGSKILLTGGELLIDKGLSIAGASAGLTVSGNNTSRVLHVTGGPVIISGLTIAEGRAVGGGGIFNDNGDLTILFCDISGNNATTGVGGGIANGFGVEQSGQLALHGSTISNNRADGRGGGIFQIAHAFITNTTISNNSSGGSGGGINNENPATLTNVTITGNSAVSGGGGVNNPGIGILTFGNTLIAGNTSSTGPDCNGFNLNSQDYNLIGNTSGGNFTGTTTHNITNVNALLGPLVANGGPTLTHALLFGSPAIDAGNSALINDQRGEPRPIDDPLATNAAGGNASDIGAYEAHNLQVNSTDDSTDGSCTAVGTGNGCTLREAITAANAESGGEAITFAPALTSGGPATITLSTALPDIASSLTIQGPGPNLLTVSRSTAGATPNFRIFFITTGNTVNLSNLTIANGNVGNGLGAGVLNNGSLVMTNCNLYGNNANAGGAGGAIFSGVSSVSSLVLNNCNIGGMAIGQPNAASAGGGIFVNSGTLTMTGGSVVGNSNQGIRLINGPVLLKDVAIINNISSGDSGGGVLTGGVTLDILNCLIAGNSANQGGGLWSNAGVVTLINSTISGNSSLGIGGGINHQSGTIRITNSTITNNRSDSDNSGAEQGGGITQLFGTATLENTIVAGNFLGSGTTPSDIDGTVDLSSSFNLIGTGGSGGLSNGANNNQVGIAQPLLGALANNGGPTQTHALLPGSLAIDAGNNCVLTNSCTPPLTSAITTDQRGVGFNRAADGNSDGAVNVDIGAYELQSILVTSTADSGAGTLRQAITDANANTGADAINFQPGLTGTITLTSALPDLSTSMVINGPGASLLAVQRSNAMATPNFRIFNVTVASPGAVTISGLTISNGNSGGGGGILNASTGTVDVINSALSNNSAISGGGIYNGSTGTVNVTDSILTNNSTAGGFGGGIFNFNNGTVNVTRSTLINNFAPDGSGGGIYSNGGTLTLTNSAVRNNAATGGSGSNSGGIFSFGGTFTVLNSTVSGNSASFGGGIFNQGGTFTLTNSTVSGNTASAGHSGGISNFDGTLTLTNSTVSGNSASSDSGGVFNSSTGTVNLKNTIVANNTVGAGGTGPDLNGTFNSQDHNLIENVSGATFTGTTTHNIIGLDPLLGPLQDNGGPTQTLALLAGSPALDAGDNCVFDNTCVPGSGVSLTTDQRGAGFIRKVDGPDVDTTDTVDIGAFEAQVSVEDIADQTIIEDSSLSLPFNVGGAASITSVTAASSNTALVPNDPTNISISGSGSTRTLLINPVANAFGASTITVTVNGNDSQTMSDTFVLTVNPVNDAPSFTKGPDQTVNENDGAQTVNNWATNISAGPGESGQTLTFNIVNNTNPALFAVAPVISSSGTLTYSPATGATGTATITIALMDNGGVANGGADTSATQSFNITVREGGTLAFSAATYSVNEGAGSATITITRSGGSAGSATVLFTTSNGTATAGDYTSVSQTITFNDGEVNKTVNVVITDDLFKETDETVNLTLSNAGGAGQLGTQTTALLTIVDDDPVGGYLRFTAANFNTTESAGSATITVEHVGETSQAVSVDYATSDGGSATVVPCSTINGLASSRCDFTTALGTLRFAAGESLKTFVVLISQDNYVEGPEGLTLTLSNLTGGALFATPSTATLTIADDATEPATNPIDVTESFVRQHYHDFLNREPDAAGLEFWTGEIENCTPKPQCTELKRINVSAAFFLSIEFQETGYLVQRMYKTAYGDTTSPNVAIPVPIIRLHEFLPDAQRIGQGVEVGVGDWQLRLEANKSAYAREFVQRQRFVDDYPLTMSAEEFVDQLDLRAGGVLSAAEREQLIEELSGATDVTQGRASVTRKVAEDADLRQREFNRAFVLMQYYGYMRRNPDDPQDTDFRGWEFWLDKLNRFNGNFVDAEMVKAFIFSIEYRQRFGP